MGTWGTSISSNDTFEDIIHEFYGLYDEGIETGDITNKLVEENRELIEDDSEDRNNLWFAIALAQWECKALDPIIFEKVKSIIASGDDLKLWQELDASPSDIKKRKKVLDQFLEKLSAEKKSARKRKKKVFRDSVFEKGDCLTFKLDSGKYGGALVLESDKQTEFGMNLIAVTDIELLSKPTVDDLKKSNVLIQKEEEGRGKYRDREMITWCYAQFFKKATTRFEVIGTIEVTRNYSFEKDFRSISQWDYIPMIINKNENLIQEKGKPEKILTLKELI